MQLVWFLRALEGEMLPGEHDLLPLPRWGGGAPDVRDGGGQWTEEAQPASATPASLSSVSGTHAAALPPKGPPTAIQV